MDNKDFGIGTDITYRYIKIRLVTNAEQTKRVGMIGYLEITEYVIVITYHFF
jgi:3,4-dihydroxy 2-butanone 4-phosphate synthase/GTP cyclohydrolase II